MVTPLEHAGLLVCGAGVGLLALLLLAVRLTRAKPESETRQQPAVLHPTPQYTIDQGETGPGIVYRHQGERWQNYCRIVGKYKEPRPILGDTSPVKVRSK